MHETCPIRRCVTPTDRQMCQLPLLPSKRSRRLPRSCSSRPPSPQRPRPFSGNLRPRSIHRRFLFFSAEDHDPFFCAAASIRARNCTASRATNLLIIQAGMFPPGSTVPMQMNIIRIHHKVRMCMNVQVSPARTLSLSASDQGRG